MSYKRICTIPTGFRESDGASVVAKVSRCSNTREFVVHLFINDLHDKEADYFTNDKDDAIATARDMMDRAVSTRPYLGFQSAVTTLVTYRKRKKLLPLFVGNHTPYIHGLQRMYARLIKRGTLTLRGIKP